MNLKRHLICSSILMTGWAALSTAQAQDVGQHPAVFAPRALPGIDPSTFLVGHPAGPAPLVHANHAHPAVTAKALRPQLDTDHYLVQPPATTRWLVGGQGEAKAATLAQRPVIVR
jgi:hypothetical protein